MVRCRSYFWCCWCIHIVTVVAHYALQRHRGQMSWILVRFCLVCHSILVHVLHFYHRYFHVRQIMLLGTTAGASFVCTCLGTVDLEADKVGGVDVAGSVEVWLLTCCVSCWLIGEYMSACRAHLQSYCFPFVDLPQIAVEKWFSLLQMKFWSLEHTSGILLCLQLKMLV